MSKPVNPAVAELMQEIARAKLQAEERRKQKAAASQQQYGIIRAPNGKLELRLPPEPKMPEPDECCGSGCTPCIMDTYWDHLSAYEQRASEFRKEYERALKGEVEHHVRSAEPISCGILDPLHFSPVRIMHIDKVCEYSRLFVLEATASNFVLALGEHIHIRATVNNGNSKDDVQHVTRPFTPVMLEADDGIVRPHLFVRLYTDNQLSTYFKQLSAGDTISVRGPIATQENLTRAFSGSLCVLAAGGSGIAPIFQALQFAHMNSAYREKRILVVHCAHDSQGLWLDKRIEMLKVEMPQLSYHTFLSRETQRVSKSLLEQVLAGSGWQSGGEEGHAIVCGPGTFNADVSSWLANLGIADTQQL